MTDPYDPPRTPSEEPSPATKDRPPTVGYLVGGLLQLGIGGFLIVRSILAEPSGVSIIGLFLVFLGIGTVVKYRARTRASRRATVRQV